MTQDELKVMVGHAALAYVVPGAVIGVGSGSTLREAAIASGWLSAEQFDAWVIAADMVGKR